MAREDKRHSALDQDSKYHTLSSLALQILAQ